MSARDSVYIDALDNAKANASRTSFDRDHLLNVIHLYETDESIPSDVSAKKIASLRASIRWKEEYLAASDELIALLTQVRNEPPKESGTSA